MLILTRKKGESIIIGDNIQIQVLNVKGGQVRIGIDAPREFQIFREEIESSAVSGKVDVAQQKPICQ